MNRKLILGGGVVAMSAAVVAIAVAQTDTPTGSVEVGSSPESPESGDRGVGVPKGPFIDFCPTLEQTDAHLARYEFDYKPTVTCSAGRELPDPPAGIQPDDGPISEAEASRQEQEALLGARALPHDGNPCTIDGEYANGDPIEIMFFVCPKEELTPAKFARGVFGR